MQKYSRILWILSGFFVLGIFPATINILTSGLVREDLADFLLSGLINVKVWQAINVLVVLATLLILMEIIVRSRDRRIGVLENTIFSNAQEISALQRKLEALEQLQFIDVVTAIPNEYKWKADVERLAASASYDFSVHAAIIDLVNFGQLNDRFGYQKVDEILRYLATYLDERMRKNEGFYRRPLGDHGLLLSQIYRKYPGGDEFYLLVQGPEADMLGLLVRLQRQLSGEINTYIKRHIAPIEEPISFYGAVCRLGRDESPAAITQRLNDYLRIARSPAAAKRVHWQSGVRSSEVDAGVPDGVRLRRLYEDAEITFANSR